MVNPKTFKCLDQLPSNIANLKPYVPGKPIAEAKREYKLKSVIKLASNENPWGYSPAVKRILTKHLTELNFYPDGVHFDLKQQLAQHLKVMTTEIAIANGSNESIDLLIRALVPSKCNIVTQQYSFIAYKVCAALHGCEMIEAAVDADFKGSVAALLNKVNDQTMMVILANPNNPTGSFFDYPAMAELAARLAERKILLVVDAAYSEFTDQTLVADAMKLYREFGNVIVLKTFSKVYGLAGLRIGYAVGPAEIISILEKARMPFNVSSLALLAAQAALKDQKFVLKTVARNNKNRKLVEKFLTQRKFKVYPSQANFVMVDFKQDSNQLFQRFLQHGVILRPLQNYQLMTQLRVSIGSDQEIKKFFGAVKAIFG